MQVRGELLVVAGERGERDKYTPNEEPCCEETCFVSVASTRHDNDSYKRKHSSPFSLSDTEAVCQPLCLLYNRNRPIISL